MRSFLFMHPAPTNTKFYHSRVLLTTSELGCTTDIRTNSVCSKCKNEWLVVTWLVCVHYNRTRLGCRLSELLLVSYWSGSHVLLLRSALMLSFWKTMVPRNCSFQNNRHARKKRSTVKFSFFLKEGLHFFCNTLVFKITRIIASKHLKIKVTMIFSKTWKILCIQRGPSFCSLWF